MVRALKQEALGGGSDPVDRGECFGTELGVLVWVAELFMSDFAPWSGGIGL